MQSQALPVSEPFEGEPQTGEQYLLRVREQANELPAISVASVPERVPHEWTSSACLSWKTALQMQTDDYEAEIDAWKNGFIRKYEATRRRLLKLKAKNIHVETPLPPIENEDAWYDICCGEKQISLARVYASMHQGFYFRLLGYHRSWLKEDLTEQQAFSIFALLCFLDMLLTADEMSVLREISKSLIALKRKLPPNDVKIIWLSLIVTIINVAFQQRDLEVND